MTEVLERPSTTGAGPIAQPPQPLPIQPASTPDSLRYRLKCRVLGQPLHSDELDHQRLGKPTALAVFASDNLSSSAYATEEILHVLVPAIGIGAFALVVPLTVAMLVVLGFLILSYRETIKEYPSAGGAYLVTRDNFGINPAQVAGVALLTDYILTVAVSVSAGTAALTSAFSGLYDYRVEIAVVFIVVICLGNLRGVKESGKVFAVPTYFFMLNMAVLLGLGFFRMLNGDLPTAPHDVEGMVHFGNEGGGLLVGASAFIALKAFASGGAAVTGVEAISNGVPAFHRPEWKNARQTLVIMGSALGVMFLGLSILAGHMKVAPFEGGNPTVISQIGELVYGGGVLGDVLYYSLQAGTMLILVLAANTSFADFPRLASFQAGDSFLPRQLTKRGHRLVFSNGIIFLSAAAIMLVIATRATVTLLIPLYAVGVFTSFTMSQSGMAKHHLRKRQPGWKHGLLVNGFGAALSAVVLIVIAAAKFVNGAWIIIVLTPFFVAFLLRLNKQYKREAVELAIEVPEAIEARVMRNHVVLVFVDSIDLAVTRAIQYAKTLTPDALRAVHFAIDDAHAQELAATWRRLGLNKIALEIVDCPDRRLARCAVDTVARDLADGDTEVTVLLPDRKYRGFWHRILHDQTAEAIEREVSQLAHANVTTVPFHFENRRAMRASAEPAAVASALGSARRSAPEPDGHVPVDATPSAHGAIPIAAVQARTQVVIEGKVRSVRVQPLHEAPSLECVVADDTGAMSIVFLGRGKIAGISPGVRVRARGTAGGVRGRLTILNPEYEILV